MLDPLRRRHLPRLSFRHPARFALASALLLSLILSNALAQTDAESFAASRRGDVELRKWEIAYDFTDRLGAAKVTGMPPAARTETAGGKSRVGIFHHPPLEVEENPGELRFDDIAIPALSPGETPILHFFIAMSDAVDLVELPHFDGCVFTVRINDEEIFSKPYPDQTWFEWAVDLTPYIGSEITVAFGIDARGNSGADWAFWGSPRILIEGRDRKMKEGPKAEWLKTEVLLAEPPEKRIVQQDDGPGGTNIVGVMDPGLDLPEQLRLHAAEAGEPPVPLPPALVVGEGPDTENHTLVRVLNRHHIAEAQFLAYPPEVRGGVAVHAARVGGSAILVTAPLSATSTREVRIFDQGGILVGAFEPDASIDAPFVLAVGNLLPDRSGDEILVAPATLSGVRRKAGVHSVSGRELKSIALPPGEKGRLALSIERGEKRDTPIAYLGASDTACRLDIAAGTHRPTPVEGAPPNAAAYPSAFRADDLLIAGAEPQFSTVQILPSSEDARPRTMDVGTRENKFWYQWRPWTDQPEERPADGKNVFFSEYRHLRTDYASPGWVGAGFRSDDPDIWDGPGLIAKAKQQADAYDSSPPVAWEPCFTHRQGHGGFEPWAEERDEATGLPKYEMLTRNNNTSDYVEFGTGGFMISTYAFGLPALDNLYVLPLRAFLRELVQPFRRNPEHIVGLEPNHEHEIAIQAEGTKGDYNPRMIQGFARYLAAQFGNTSEAWQAALGVQAGEYFDAPRNWDRAGWDEYTETNPFFNEWIAFNRYVVNRRIAQTFREALLAGYAPEIIKSHQIPDSYAIGDLSAFSTVVSRYTPIDYAMNAGVGYGFTRYSVWYKKEHNVMQGAYSSGFDNVLIGEYQALTPSDEDAYGQLRYIFNYGGYSVHCMRWPDGHDKGYNASMAKALERLVDEDPKRPGVTGGVGQIRAVAGETGTYNIACIGTGRNRTGLLKSLNRDGSWEGSVYVTPFHAHVDIDTVSGSALPNDAGWTFGPLNDLDSGSQLELTFEARATTRAGKAHLQVLRRDTPLPGLSADSRLTNTWRRYRFALRVQLPVEDIRIALEFNDSGAETRNVLLTRQTEQTTKLTKGILEGRRHRGGVTFDILEGSK